MIWVNISRLGTSAEVGKHLREQAKVAVSLGKNYGLYGEGYLRLNIAILDETKFNDALKRIQLALTELAKEKGIF